MIVELFNDKEHIVTTMPLKSLHNDFAHPIECPAGEYVLTIEKAKGIMQLMKAKLRTIVGRYNASGNGSDMVILDSADENYTVEQNELTYGRFNSEKALEVARAEQNHELLLKDGDDWSNFLQHKTPALLYWWQKMDEHNLLFFTCTILDDTNSVLSNSTPKAVSRHRKAVGMDSHQDSSTKEMSDSVRKT
jgi:hypothetical protein